MQIHDVCRVLEHWAPPHLAESWDNVGLLLGDGDAPVSRVMACLTVTPASAAEALDEGAELIVTHHPLPFRPLVRITPATTPGGLVWRLARGGVAVYSAHTAFDSAAVGINQQLAEGLGLADIAPLRPGENEPAGLGAGRWGVAPAATTLGELAERLARFLAIDGLQMVGDAAQRVERVAVACGSAGEFLAAAREQRCQVLVTGETSFHTCLEAEATGMALLLPGHYASERFAQERLAARLAAEFPALAVWCSRRERDPLVWRSARRP